MCHALLNYATIGHPKLKSSREVVTDTVHLYATTVAHGILFIKYCFTLTLKLL